MSNDNARLAIDVRMKYETQTTGTKGDDRHPYRGNKILKVEFHKNVEGTGGLGVPVPFVGRVSVPGTGRGDARITETTGSYVCVHYWLEPAARLNYTLKVWVSD